MIWNYSISGFFDSGNQATKYGYLDMRIFQRSAENFALRSFLIINARLIFVAR